MLVINIDFGLIWRHLTKQMKQHNGFFNKRSNSYSNKFNPANVPKVRRIEDFWSILAEKVDEGGWKAKPEFQLKRRIYQKMKQINMKIVEHIMTGIRTR